MSDTIGYGGPYLKVRWYDRSSKRQRELTLRTDCVEVVVPEQPEYNGQPNQRLPTLAVNVNTDAVIVDKLEDDERSRVAMHEFTDLLAELETSSE